MNNCSIFEYKVIVFYQMLNFNNMKYLNLIAAGLSRSIDFTTKFFVKR